MVCNPAVKQHFKLEARFSPFPHPSEYQSKRFARLLAADAADASTAMAYCGYAARVM